MSLSVLPWRTTISTPSVIRDITAASVTILIGEVSRKIYSYISDSLSSTFSIAAEPSSSAGFGGISPDGIMSRLGYSVCFITESTLLRLASTFESPGDWFMLSKFAMFGFLKSQSTKTTFAPA